MELKNALSAMDVQILIAQDALGVGK